MKKNSASFIIKCILLALPFMVIAAVYFICDPYMVLHKYKRYDKSCMFLNESFVGWQTYLNNKDSAKFNSFMLGNSCTMGIKCSSWEKYIGKDSHAIRLYGNAERLSSVYLKMKALDSIHAPLKHVMVVANITLVENSTLTPFATNLLPPGQGDISEAQFQCSFLQAFFVPSNLFSFLDYNIFHQYRKSMDGIINPFGVIRNPINCEAINPHEEEIAKMDDRYWTIHKGKFELTRKASLHKPVIREQQYELLMKIANICRKNHTDFKFIIGPEYDQVKLNHKDFIALQKVFGRNNVYDFTGKNCLTDNIHNFYDPDHFRPIAGDYMLKVVYGQSFH